LFWADMMMMRVALTLLLGVASGFQVPLAVRRAPFPVIMGIAESAAGCLEDGCSVDMVESLVIDLKSECVMLNQNGQAASARNQQVLTLISQLEVLNINPEANKSEIEKIIAGASRSFSKLEPYPFPGEPLGYTGTVGTTTTAGKALN